MTKNMMAQKINSVEDVMADLEYADSEMRQGVMKWLKNLRDDINSFLKEYGTDE